VNGPLLAAGSVSIAGAAIHGAGGERLVVRKLQPEALPASRFGGPRMTQAMIQATWHMTTIAFLAVGGQLVVAGAALHGDPRRVVAVASAIECAGFAALAVWLGAARLRSARSLIRHPGPLLLTTTAALAWWGALA
jgi:hypothetical protein